MRSLLLFCALLIGCGWMLSSVGALAQDTPRVEPVIRHPDRYDQDFDGIIDSLDDLIAQAVATGESWRERTVVVTLWEPCQEWHLAQARRLGGRIGPVYTHVCYGFAARLPIWAIPYLAHSLGKSLCVIESPDKGSLEMDIASQIVMARPVVWDTYCHRGDAWSSIAVIDTGLDIAHDDLGDDNLGTTEDWYDVGAQGNDWAFTGGDHGESQYKVVGWWDEEDGPQDDPFDPDGHGTHVSGILSGFGRVESDYRGIAPRTRLVGLRMDPDDDGYAADLAQAVAAMDQVVAKRIEYRIKACNISWKFPDSPTLKDKANTMANNGVLPVVAAGNGTMQDPAPSEMALTVGATNDNDELTTYSAWGPSGGDPLKPDVVAPGGSTLHGSQIMSCDNSPDDGYTEMHGTSMAAPVVAGEAALVLEALGKVETNWDWTSSSDALGLKSLILMTAWETQRGEDDWHIPPLNRGGKDRKEGYGRVNADAAIEAATMTYSVGLTARGTLGGTFGDICYGKKVWARRMVFFPDDEDCTLRLTMPAEFDADLFVYDVEPDEYGQPVILYSSTSVTPGQTEVIVRPANSEDTVAYIVVKDAQPRPAFFPCYSYTFNLGSSTATNADEVWIKDFDGDDGTVSCLKTSSCGGPTLAICPVSPDIRTEPDPPPLGEACDVYVTVRNKTDHVITDASVEVYLDIPMSVALAPTWEQTGVSIPAGSSTQVGPFHWDEVQNNPDGEPYWHIRAAVTTPRDGIRLGYVVLGEDNVAVKAITVASLFADANPGSPGFGEHFDLYNTLDVPATAMLGASRLAIPPEWGFYIYPPLDTPVHLDPGEAITGEMYIYPPVSSSMGVSGVIDLVSSLIPDDDSAEYDMFRSMTVGLCTDEEFSDESMSDWVVDSQGTSVFIDLGNFVSEPASMRIDGSPAGGAYARCTSPPVDLDFMKPYRLSFSMFWDDVREVKLVEFGHIRLLVRSQGEPLEYDPDGDWANLVPIGAPFDVMLPPAIWGEVVVAVDPAMFEYKIWVNGFEVGTAAYDRWLEPAGRLHIEDQAISGSALAANFDDIAPIGTPPEVEPVVYRSSSPSGWINPRWNMISIPLDPSGSCDARSVLGMNPWGHLFAWDRFLKTTVYYGAQFTQMLPGEGYKFYTESEVAQPTYFGTATHRPFETALPKLGWSWIGCPSDSPILLSDCEIRNEATGATRLLEDDGLAPDPWMNWAFYWWDSANERWCYAGAVEFPGIDDSLRPWRGYMTWQRTDDLTLIIP